MKLEAIGKEMIEIGRAWSVLGLRFQQAHERKITPHDLALEWKKREAEIAEHQKRLNVLLESLKSYT